MKNLIISDEFKKPEFFTLARLPIYSSSKEILLLKLTELNYIEADGSYSKIHTNLNQTCYHTCKNIGYYERILPSHSFLRIHNKYIVNLSLILCLRQDNHWSIELTNKSILKVSDEKRNELLLKLGLKHDRLVNLKEI